MAELKFSRSDVEGLADKLVAIELSERERTLLLAVFGEAARRVSPGQPRAPSDLNELREQLIHSFLPDSGDKFVFDWRGIGRTT